jgi:hypothetical protein
MKKKERQMMIDKIGEYYQSIHREKTPRYDTYSNGELQACIRLFGIKI